MKKNIIYLLCIYLSGIFSSCSKDDFKWNKESDFPENPDVTGTVYQKGETYTRKFYYTSSTCIEELSTHVVFVESITSECGRLYLNNWNRDNLLPFDELNEKKREILKKNPPPGRMYLYLVAEFTFTYVPGEGTIWGYARMVEQKTDWEIIQGYPKEYMWEGEQYWQLLY